MKELILVRHAKSSWDHAWLSDIERPLNDRGLRDAPVMAKKLKEEGAIPDYVLSSPAQRALATASIFMHHLGINPSMMRIEPGLYEATASRVDQIVQKLPAQASRVMIVGHNPVFTDWINRYAPHMIDNLPTCGVAWFRLDMDSWDALNFEKSQLLHIWFPKML